MLVGVWQAFVEGASPLYERTVTAGGYEQALFMNRLCPKLVLLRETASLMNIRRAARRRYSRSAFPV